MGLLSNLERKNCWTIAEERGDVTPHGLQHMLSRASWGEERLLMICVTMCGPHSPTPMQYWSSMELGDLKKGYGDRRCATPIHRYCRTDRELAGRGVSDRRRRAWASSDRCRAVPAEIVDAESRPAGACVPADVEFATKPTIAQRMIAEALVAGVRASWVAGDDIKPLLAPATINAGQRINKPDLQL